MTPILTADSIDEIWHSFAERQCAYEDTKRQTAAMSKPGSQNLHCRRINPGEKHSGQKAQTDGHPRIVRQQREAAVHRRARDRGEGEEVTRTNQVRQIQKGAQKCSYDEAELNGKRQPTCCV